MPDSEAVWLAVEALVALYLFLWYLPSAVLCSGQSHASCEADFGTL